MKSYLFKLWIGILLASDILFVLVYKLFDELWFPPATDPETADFAMLMFIGGIHQFCFVALSLFLNINRRFRKSPVRRFLSFYLLPILLLLLQLRITEDSTTIGLMAPFFICLTVAYILFSRHLKKNEINE